MPVNYMLFPKYKPEVKPKFCEFCGEMFFKNQKESYVSFESKRFCGHLCAQRARSRYKTLDQWLAARKPVDRGPANGTLRLCLKCDVSFKSLQPKSSNRICPSCTAENNSMERVGGRTATKHKCRKGDLK